MRKHSIIFYILVLSFLVLAAGCYQPGGPVPERPHDAAERAWTTGDVDAMVIMEEVLIESPAPDDNGTPPVSCDDIHFLRIRLNDSIDDPSQADAILVLMPGLIGGNNSFEYLGRQLVYMARTQHDARMEVWGVDRRGNCLEDLTGLNAAEEAQDIGTYIDYYYYGTEIDGRTFDGFLKDEDVPFLSEFGLELVMEDIFKIITTMVPSQELRREKVFIGGHSLGGILTSMFAGWDFDGDPETLDDAGYMNCAGLIGLDTFVSPMPEMLDPYLNILPEAMYDQLANMVEGTYEDVVEGLRSGSTPRILPLPLLTAESFALLELQAMLADWYPAAESTVLDEVPYSDDVDHMLKFVHSKSLDHFMMHVPDITDFRYTNEAGLGVIMDDNFMPISLVQASMGFLKGGAVVEKDFPLPGDLAGIPILSDLMGVLLSLESMYIANDAGPSSFELGQGPLYSWANFDEIGNDDFPEYQDTEGNLTYTTMVEEVTDIQDFARAIYKGPSNLVEWYFSMRLIVDLVAATFPFGVDYGIDFLHEEHVWDLPMIEFITGNGPFMPMLGLLPGEHDPIEGYSHLDVLTEAVDRPSHRKSEVIAPLIEFVMDNIEAE